MMFYRNTAIITVVGMLLLIGMGPREKLIPNSLVQALSTPVKSNNSKGASVNVPKPNATATGTAKPNATATAAATAAATAKPNSTAAATGTAVAK